MVDVRKGQAPGQLARDEFGVRFRKPFFDPAFDREGEAIARLEEIAWQAYKEERKSPRTRKAGPGYADPEHELSVDWLAAKDRIDKARERWADPASTSRVLVICGASRNDGTCPGEMSKSFRLTGLVCAEVHAAGMQSDLLDLSLLVSEYGRHIHPCKGCVSTAMPLCHFPCSCYPNHALNQSNDWMNEIYERWTAAHGVVIVTPTYWYQSPCGLKLMVDRLVCADGGNPDPTSTHGKTVEEAKNLELAGWNYPKHLDKRAYGLVVHGDVAGIEGSRRALSDWLDWMGLVESGFESRLDRYIGYYEPYATSHEALDRDQAVQEEVRNVARAVVKTVKALRSGALATYTTREKQPRPK